MKSYSNSNSIEDMSYEAFYEICKRIFEAIDNDFDFYKVILGDDSMPYLSVKFNNLFRVNFGVERSRAKDFYIEHYISGFVGIIKLWIKNPDVYLIDEVSKLLTELYSTDMITLLNK